jgi:hypothetical protein
LGDLADEAQVATVPLEHKQSQSDDDDGKGKKKQQPYEDQGLLLARWIECNRGARAGQGRRRERTVAAA